MYSRRMTSRRSKRRLSKRARSILKMRVPPPNHLAKCAPQNLVKKLPFEGTRIPIGKFKPKKSLTAVNQKSTKKTLEKMVPLRNNGRSYTVLMPVTPLHILKKFANVDNARVPDAVEHEPNSENRKLDFDKTRGSYTLVNPVFSTELLKVYANVDEVNSSGNQKEKLLEIVHVRNVEGEPNDQILIKELKVNTKFLPDDHGDELSANRADSNTSILNNVRTLFREGMGKFDEEVTGKKMPRVQVSEIDCRRQRKATRIPIRMKKPSSWEQTNVNVIHLTFNCECGVVERKSLTF